METIFVSQLRSASLIDHKMLLIDIKDNVSGMTLTFGKTEYYGFYKDDFSSNHISLDVQNQFSSNWVS